MSSGSDEYALAGIVLSELTRNSLEVICHTELPAAKKLVLLTCICESMSRCNVCEL